MNGHAGSPDPAGVAAAVDHLVFGSPELADGVRHVERLLGVAMEPGGRHLGLGTHNRLLGLGERAYLEVVSPDPGQPPPDGPRWFGLDDLAAPRLVTWCVSIRHLTVPELGGHVSDLDTLVRYASHLGFDLGAPREGERARSDGLVLRWAMTDPWADRSGGVIPFFIDWGSSPHPAERLRPTCILRALRAAHPEAGRIRTGLRALGLEVAVSEAEAPSLVATLDGPAGAVELT